ncbi:hypothetical protein BURPS1710b_0894 [Burkholderia pseudomallei 1710b]|uniref:Uncharacterized protein n=1 Tax=Burkholderia pseudomallei (strain 1710b) TaxID=320372 RepID=Q3JVU6_BURP1|nr:hypothetical protein BURPS1710b_0894 [Burkholderia pseudomallei 1710b]
MNRPVKHTTAAKSPQRSLDKTLLTNPSKPRRARARRPAASCRHVPARRHFGVHRHAKRPRLGIARIAQRVRLIGVEHDRVARREQLAALMDADFERAFADDKIHARAGRARRAVFGVQRRDPQLVKLGDRGLAFRIQRARGKAPIRADDAHRALGAQMLETVDRVAAQERGDRHLQRGRDLAEHLDRRHAARRFDLREHRARHAREPRERVERQLAFRAQPREIHADEPLERIERRMRRIGIGRRSGIL